MELVSGSHIPDGLLAAITLLSEKPRQGVPSWNPAPIQGISEANCTALLGLRFGCSGIASGTVVAPSKPTPCKNGLGTGGAGVGAGYNLDAGVGAAGASSTGGVGAGAFRNSGSGFSGGLFGSGGATAYAGSHIAGAPTQTRSTFSLGAYAGAGANFFFTNAGGAQQLSGPFTTVSINVGVGVANLGVQLSFGGGIYQLSVTPPLASVGIGAAGSVVTTNTVATRAGCH